jgi:hypothetical protein
MGRRQEATIRREAEDARMSRAERDFAKESTEDHQADEFVQDHLGGINPERLLGDDEAGPLS